MISARRHVISAGHYLAAHAGFAVLEAGGNAIDAGVAAGIALGVLQSDIVNVAGVAPIILYHAESRKVFTVSGLGVWPKLVTPDYFMNAARRQDPARPAAHGRAGGARCLDPGAAALGHHELRRGGRGRGSLRQGRLRRASAAVRDHHHAPQGIRGVAVEPGHLSAERPSAAGRRGVRAERPRQQPAIHDRPGAGGPAKGREAGLEAARAAFYTGDIGRTIVAYHEENGGLLRMATWPSFAPASSRPSPCRSANSRCTPAGCGARDPVLGQMLRLVEATGCHKQPHNSFEYVHALTEIMKLAFADRHAYYGDPASSTCRSIGCCRATYAAERARARPRRQGMAGHAAAGTRASSGMAQRAPGPIATSPQPQLDTSYVCVGGPPRQRLLGDAERRLEQHAGDPGHGAVPVLARLAVVGRSRASPASVAPGKRPRLTPSPALASGPDGRAIPFGTPGGDVQAQAMLQTLLNRIVFGMDPQAAIEAPRFATYSFPDSFEPHSILPGRLVLEARLPQSARPISSRSVGHDVQWWPDWTWKAGAICMIDSDPKAGLHHAGADPRRSTYAVGW